MKVFNVILLGFFTLANCEVSVSVFDLLAHIRLESYDSICILIDTINNNASEDELMENGIKIMGQNEQNRIVSINNLDVCVENPISSLVISNFKQLDQLTLVSTATIILLENPDEVPKRMKHFPLDFASKLFVVFKDLNNVIGFTEVYRVKPNLHLQIHRCPLNFDPSDSVWGHRNNFYGAELSLVYDFFEPFCYLKDQELSGIMYDVMEVVAEKLNFTTRYTENPEKYVWGGVTSNGSLSGMFGQVERGQFDSSIAGFVSTFERYQHIDFTISVATGKMGKYSARDKTNRVTSFAFTKELTYKAWVAFGFHAGVVFLTFALFFNAKTAKSLKNYTTSIDYTLKAIINKAIKEPLHSKHCLSWKILLFTVYLAEFVLLSQYKSAMNAFLTVKSNVLPVENMKDVFDQNYNLLIWQDGAIEDYLKNSPKTTYEWKVYEKLFINGNPEKHNLYFKSMDEAVSIMLTEDLIFMNSQEQMHQRLEYQQCKIVKISNEKMPYSYLTFPLAKGSPYKPIFDLKLSKLLERGGISRIVQRHTGNQQNQACSIQQARKVSLGYNNLFFPFLVLIASIVLTLIIALVERLTSFHQKKRKENNEFNMDDQNVAKIRQIILSDQDSTIMLNQIYDVLGNHFEKSNEMTTKY